MMKRPLPAVRPCEDSARLDSTRLNKVSIRIELHFLSIFVLQGEINAPVQVLRSTTE